MSSMTNLTRFPLLAVDDIIGHCRYLMNKVATARFFDVSGEKKKETTFALIIT